MTDKNHPEPETACHHVVYHGRVQGVGFRLTATHIARNFPVVGYVKNMPNRTVEMVVRGDGQALEKFLKAIEEQFEGHNDNRELREATPNECFEIESKRGFEIRY
jgi:acylphosphatase